MANPVAVTAGTDIEASWGNAVRSRVVGIYATTAAAETDGATEAGRLITLTDGSVWVKRSATSGDWARVHPWVKADQFAAFTLPTVLTSYLTQTFVMAPNYYLCDVFGRALISCTAVTAATVIGQIRISINGGSSYNLGGNFRHDIAAGAEAVVGIEHFRLAVTPTNSVIVDLRLRSTQSDTTLDAGIVKAEIQADFA